MHACLDWIERSELFLISLDNNREWYRYHHLFQQSLQQRLSGEIPPEQVIDLHRLASAWFEEQGLVDEALQHALAAGDLDLAARQMTAGLRDVINREDRPTLERWLRSLPEEMIQRQPGLLMIKAWILQFLWRLDLQAQVLEQVEDLYWMQTEVHRCRRMTCSSCGRKSFCLERSRRISPTSPCERSTFAGMP